MIPSSSLKLALNLLVSNNLCITETSPIRAICIISSPRGIAPLTLSPSGAIFFSSTLASCWVAFDGLDLVGPEAGLELWRVELVFCGSPEDGLDDIAACILYDPRIPSCRDEGELASTCCLEKAGSDKDNRWMLQRAGSWTRATLRNRWSSSREIVQWAKYPNETRRTARVEKAKRGRKKRCSLVGESPENSTAACS